MFKGALKRHAEGVAVGKKKKADVSAKELAADMVVGGLLAVLSPVISPVPAMTYATIRAADYEKRLGRRRKGKEIVLATGSISILSIFSHSELIVGGLRPRKPPHVMSEPDQTSTAL